MGPDAGHQDDRRRAAWIGGMDLEMQPTCRERQKHVLSAGEEPLKPSGTTDRLMQRWDGL